MKKTLLLIFTIITSLLYAQDCSQLFFSEYVEGWSNNKALEIYNPTGNAIDLSAYMVMFPSYHSCKRMLGALFKRVTCIDRRRHLFG